MQHVYCCHVRDYTVPDLFQIYFSNRLTTSVISDLGIRTLHIFGFFKPCRSFSNTLHVCDDWIIVPLGMLTLSGMCAACLSLHGGAADEKNLVHPESRIAVSFVVTSVKDGVQSKDSVK
jgi:hypothetical protein